MTMRFNIADEARRMDSSELAASIKALTDEQNSRRVSVDGADPDIYKMLQDEHSRMYGAQGQKR